MKVFRSVVLIAAVTIGVPVTSEEVDPCTFGIPLAASGPIVVVVTLQESSASDPALPTLGASEINRLSVRARIDEVRKGSFRYPVGTSVNLAIHSVALTFGYDYAGERYEVGLDLAKDGSYRIASISPEEAGRFQVRGRVLGGKPAAKERSVVFDKESAVVVRVQIESVEGGGLRVTPGDVVSMKIRTGKDSGPKTNQEICLFGLYRPQRSDRPYRQLRVAY